MTFKKDSIFDFQNIFEQNKTKIRASEGCSLLELYQDKNVPTVFFTYSYWIDETHLNLYRSSALFKQVWSKTKVLFDAKPEAWSVDKIESLE